MSNRARYARGERVALKWIGACVALLALFVTGISCSGESGPLVAPSPEAGTQGSPSVSSAAPEAIRTSMGLLSAHADLAPRLAPTHDGWLREGELVTSPGWRGAAVAPRYDIGATLPDRADGTLAVGIGRSRDQRILLVAEGAASQAVELHEGRAVYSNAYRATDVILVTTNLRLEEMLLLRNDAAPSEFSWRVERGRGLPNVHRDPSGSLVFADERGRDMLRIPRPFAVDANGVRRDADLAWNKDTMSIRLDTQGLAYPILLDPAVETGIWTQLGLPEARRQTAIVYDSARQRTVLYGGANGFGDTWEWDGFEWLLMSPFGQTPPALYFHSMAFDTARQKTVLFGGQDATTAYRGETWEWDGVSWVQACTTAPCNLTVPVPRSQFAMAFDSNRNKTVLFGGGNGSLLPAETWEWDGAIWTKSVVAAPTPRVGHAMSYDSTAKLVLLFGGFDGARKNDLWTWNGTVWANPFTGGPPIRNAHAMAYDSIRNRTVVFGGDNGTATHLNDTWEWNGAAWNQICAACVTLPVGRVYHAMAFDAARAKVLLFAGQDSTNTYLRDLWGWSGAAWATQATGPANRFVHATAYDVARANTVLFGGYNGASFNDTWVWNGTSWTQKLPITVPTARYSHSMAYDSGRGFTVMFSGYTGALPQETYEWDGTNWFLRTPVTSPAGRRDFAMAYDAARGVTVLFAGFWGGATNDTWTWTGLNWVQKFPTTNPPWREYHAMAYDAHRQRVVLFGGTSTFPTGLQDTWEWDGTNWSNPSNSGPPPRSQHSMFYDSATQKVVVYGGADSTNSPIGDTWEWDGATWTPVPATGPTARVGTPMAFDTARHRGVLFGGRDSSSNNRGDSWEYHSHGQSCTLDAQCDTGHCVDSVCCEQATCNGSCLSCDTPLSPGQCSPVFNADDPNSCTGSYTCNAAGVCRFKTGQGCTLASDCSSSFCSDGYCCDKACTGGCDVCNAPAGTCTVIAAGSAGTNPACSPAVCDGTSPTCPTSCTSDTGCAAGDYCSAAGTCQGRKTATSTCNDAAGADCKIAGCRVCTGSTCSDGFCCNTACSGACDVCAQSLGATANGTCTTAAAGYVGNPSCGVYLCTGASASCPTTCTTDTGCATGYFCGAGGTCQARKGQGQSCNLTTDCKQPGCGECSSAGGCVDGFCCNAACGGACDNCSNTPGTCSFSTAGTPGNPGCGVYLCSGTAAGCPGSCTTDAQCSAGNYCNGATCVAKKVLGIGCVGGNECSTGFCADGVCCNGACSGACDACNGSGQCLNVSGAGAPSCTPFVCTGTSASCPTSCANDGQCIAGDYCAAGACVSKKILGGGCVGGNECSTGFCADGVCCNGACGGACDACNSSGQCLNVTGSGNPSCGGYLCSGSSPNCPAACTTDTQCASGYFCAANGTCQAQRLQGQACSLTTDCKQAGCAECTTSNCVDGFCCNTACGGACDNCSATPGTCALAATGFPGNPACGTYVCSGTTATCPASCTLDAQCSAGNYCNGAGCVAKKPLGTGCGVSKECTSGFCADGVCCDGACGGPCDACNSSGQCLNVTGAGAPTCSPYVCSGTSAACPPSCTSDANCASGFFCNGSACIPKLGLGQACTGANQCALANCVDGVCCASACGGACDACNSSGQCVNVAGGGNPTCGAYVCSGTGPACPASCSTDAQCATGYFCTQGGTCQPQKSQGQSCGVTDCSQAGCRECSTGNCADGFCCNQTCSGACDTCSATPGVCTFLAAGNGGSPACAPYLCSGSAGSCPTSCTADAQCSSGNFCDGVACVPTRSQGASCTAKNQCGSAFCVDGVCCDTACTGTCQACLAALKESGVTDGQCDAAKSGGDPHNDCPDEGTASCKRDGTCNGTGACRLYANGTSCDIGTTCSGNLVTGKVCNGSGTCALNASGTDCAPYKCSGTKCAIPCASDNDCQAGNFCDLVAGGTCKARLAQGQSCGGDDQCTTGHCVDAVCCDTKCDGFCQACTAAKQGGNGVTGTCGPIANGLDPDNECPDNGPTACKEDGYCNGSGACRFYTKGTTCGSTTCASGVSTTQSCDGLGTCGVGAVANCTPYTCDISGTTCAQTCADDTLCSFGNYCASGLCTPQSTNGQTCTADDQCTTGHCADGVCCDTKCDGNCQACTDSLKQSGDTTGTCGPAKADTDPHNNCIDDGVTGCQHNGNCDGQGQCGLYKNGTSCGDTTCVGDKTMGFQQSGFACNGGGSCLANAVVDCGQFACKNSACLSTCADGTDCKDGAFCDQTAMPPVCKLKSKSGTKCTVADQCESQSCVDGYCCNTACQGQCEACDIAGTEGSCAPVSGKPHGTRSECAKATADNVCAEAQCDGNTRATCAGFVGSTAECRPAACKGGVATLSAKCDGKGQCPAQTTKVCEPYGCDTTTCKETCKADTDCTSGYRCDTGVVLASEGGTSEGGASEGGTGSNKCLSGATCDGDHTINAPNQPATNCSPYKCQAGGTCKTQCSSVDDCAMGFACDLDGKCAVETFSQPASGSSGGCGCRVGASTEDFGRSTWAMSILLGLGVVFRSRASKRSRGRRAIRQV